MNYFENQRRINQKTTRLYCLFAVYVVLTGVFVNFLVALFDYSSATGDIGLFYMGFRFGTMPSIIIALLTMSIILYNFLKSFFKITNGVEIAESIGCIEVTGKVDDPKLRQLNHVVEEMAIAAAIPVPRVFIIENATGINAFATGTTYNNSVIAVTRKALELNRDKLQALIAHEMGHIRSLDVKFNLHVAAVLSGFMAITTLGFFVLRSMGNVRSTSKSNRGNGIVIVLGLALFLIVAGYFFYIIGRFIQSRISVKREYAADLNAVISQREALPMIFLLGDIKKESANEHKIPALREEYAHFLFSSVRMSFFGFNTHPPIDRRIMAIRKYVTKIEIDKRVEPTSVEIPTEQPSKNNHQQETSSIKDADLIGKMAAAGIISGLVSKDSDRIITPEMRERIEEARPNVERIEMQINEMINQISEKLLQFTNDKFKVDKLFYALLLSSDRVERDKQLTQLPENKIEGVLTAYSLLIGNQFVYQYLLAELAYPILHQLDNKSLDELILRMSAMVESMDHVTMRQICLILSVEKMVANLRKERDESFRTINRENVKSFLTMNISESMQILFSALVLAGKYQDKEEEELHFLTMLQKIYPSHQRKITRLNETEWKEYLVYAFNHLAKLSDSCKDKLMDVILETIFIDNSITSEEYELVRVIGIYLDYYLPLDLREAYSNKMSEF